MILLDTHAWVWWVSDPERLSAPAQRAIDDAARGGRLLVSSISVWELSLLVARARLRLRVTLSEWLAVSEQLPFLQFLPVDNRVALAANELPGELHRDPADRMIVATARVLETTLVTKDARLIAYPHVTTLW